MIELTESAKNKIIQIIQAETAPCLYLRVYVEGGGCSGFNYGFTLDETKDESDWVVEAGSFQVLVDPVSMQYLDGATIDYKKSLLSENFVIKNPNAKSSCGCGSSFAV